jgi:hypothetical protein
LFSSPWVNREKLRELLGWEAEYPTLDFKSDCDPSLTQDLVELAKDVGAMSVRGGFLVIAAALHARPHRSQHRGQLLDRVVGHGVGSLPLLWLSVAISPNRDESFS